MIFYTSFQKKNKKWIILLVEANLFKKKDQKERQHPKLKHVIDYEIIIFYDIMIMKSVVTI